LFGRCDDKIVKPLLLAVASVSFWAGLGYDRSIIA